MKYLITLTSIIVFAMVTPQVTAQSGGFNVKNVNASENVTVGSENFQNKMTDRSFTLQPLTNFQIGELVPEPGMLVYATESDVVLVFDGVWWKRFDGQNDNYLDLPPPPPPCGSTFYDQDGNAFESVQIGDQCWMAENLKYLPSVVGPATGSKTDSYYYVYNYDGTDVAAAKATANFGTYGVLYNWPAAMSACPDGWHLPSEAEWTQLTNFIESEGHSSYNVGKVLRAESGWDYYNGTDDYGFTGLPGGNRYDNLSKFQQVGQYGYWWSATGGSDNSTAFRRLMFGNNGWSGLNSNKAGGYSVRCVRN